MNVIAKKAGDTVTVELPREVAKRLGVADGGTLALTPTPNGVELRPNGVRPEVMAAHRESMERYGELYKKLAE